MDIKLGLPYGSDAMQKWDLYLPKLAESSESKARGIIIFVHGGAWRSGDKEEHRELATNLVNTTQLPVAVPNYRLSPRNPTNTEPTLKHPTHAQDIALALSVIKSSAHLETVANTNHITLVGHSCGAHMICTLMLNPPNGEGISLDPPLSLDVYESVKGILLAEGIYDIDLLLESFPTEYYRNFIEGAFPASSETFAQFSVNRYKVRGGPPIPYFVVHSMDDTLVDVKQAAAMYTWLQSEYESLHGSSALVRKGFSDQRGDNRDKKDSDDDWKLGDHDEMLKTDQFARLVASML